MHLDVRDIQPFASQVNELHNFIESLAGVDVFCPLCAGLKLQVRLAGVDNTGDSRVYCFRRFHKRLIHSV